MLHSFCTTEDMVVIQVWGRESSRASWDEITTEDISLLD